MKILDCNRYMVIFSHFSFPEQVFVKTFQPIKLWQVELSTSKCGYFKKNTSNRPNRIKRFNLYP